MEILKSREFKPLIWVDAEFKDFDQFGEATRDWDIDFYQLDDTPFHSSLQHVILPEIQIGHTTFDTQIDQKGASPKNMWSFIILDNNSSMFSFNHEKTQSTSTMLIYPPGEKINVVSTQGFGIYVFSVEKSHLHNIAISLGLKEIEKKLAEIDRVELTQEQANRLREELKSILSSISMMEDKVLMKEEKKLYLELLPIEFLKEIHIHAGCATKKNFKKKHILLMQIRAHMHTNIGSYLTIEDIAEKFDLSSRTLRNYFLEEFNTSPKQYLRALRLAKVRYELELTPRRIKSIENTARKFGFHHMGQFSKAYKDFFGELPSQTLLK